MDTDILWTFIILFRNFVGYTDAARQGCFRNTLRINTSIENIKVLFFCTLAYIFNAESIPCKIHWTNWEQRESWAPGGGRRLECYWWWCPQTHHSRPSWPPGAPLCLVLLGSKPLKKVHWKKVTERVCLMKKRWNVELATRSFVLARQETRESCVFMSEFAAFICPLLVEKYSRENLFFQKKKINGWCAMRCGSYRKFHLHNREIK